MRGMLVAAALSAVALGACGRGDSPAAAQAHAAGAQAGGASEAGLSLSDEAVDLSAAKAGVYAPDPNHRHILFNYDHQGYSRSWVRWRDWTARLDWNPDAPESSSIRVTIDAAAVDSGVDIFDDHLRGGQFFDVENHPTITFVSTGLERTGDNTGRMTGDLTIKGITKPVTLDVAISKASFEERPDAYKLGFSARGTVLRSDFDVDSFVPIVSDAVELVIETEFMSEEKGR